MIFQDNIEHALESGSVALRVQGLTVGFGEKHICEDLNLIMYGGEILGVIGASGEGKSILMRTIIGLIEKQAGTVEIFPGGKFNDAPILNTKRKAQSQFGVLFQHGALFSSLSVLENIMVPLREHMRLDDEMMRELAMSKIRLVGLSEDAAPKYPSELSGGMIKRAGIARALALDPSLLFLDEPTSGLDPVGAGEFDELILELRSTLGLTVFMITHDLDTLYQTCDRIVVFANRQIVASGAVDVIEHFDHPWTRSYFQGKRARMKVRQ